MRMVDEASHTRETATTNTGTVPAPKHQASEFLAYEAECKAALAPLLTGLLDLAESAGWNRRTVASTLMLLAAQKVSAGPASNGQPDRGQSAR
jgi:hypothetical protein